MGRHKKKLPKNQPKMDKKNIIIVCLLVALVAVSWIAFGKDNPSPVDNTLLKKRLVQLESEKVKLTMAFNKQVAKADEYKSKNDSLEKLKPNIKYEYIKKVNQIDSSNTSLLVNDFNNVFTNNDIK